MSLSKMHSEFTCINNKERDQDKVEWVGFCNYLPINLIKSRKDQIIFSKEIFSSAPNYLVSKKNKNSRYIVTAQKYNTVKLVNLKWEHKFSNCQTVLH